MQLIHEDLGKAREAALECVRAVGDAFESVFRCADEKRFLQDLSALELGLARANDAVVPLFDEFNRANQRESGPTCAGVRVESAPPSSHALAVEVARKLLRTVEPIRRLPSESLKDALLTLHKELLSVVPGRNALEQLTEAKSFMTRELDSLQASVWTESTMAEVLRGRLPRPSPSAAASSERSTTAGARKAKASSGGAARRAKAPRSKSASGKKRSTRSRARK